MTAITISREIGSQGDLIAERTAQRLGFQLVDKNTIEKIFSQYGLVDFKAVYDATGFWAQFDPHRTEMVSFLNRVIETATYQGRIVLLGRGGFALLKGYADVLNVRIQAPFSLRVQRVKEEQVLETIAEAEAFVRKSDQMRRDFVNSMFSERWDSVSAFDLVIDTGKISQDQAVALLEETALYLSHVQFNDVPTTHALKIDHILLDAVGRFWAAHQAEQKSTGLQHPVDFSLFRVFFTNVATT